MKSVLWLPISILLVPLLTCGCFTRYDYYRNEPSPIERGQYEWLSERFGPNILYEFLQIRARDKEAFLLGLLQENPEGRKCLTKEGDLAPVRGAPGHCLLLWFPELPTWEGPAEVGGRRIRVLEYPRRDWLWHVFVDPADEAVMGWTEHRWRTRWPTYWETYEKNNPKPALLETARREREAERLQQRERALNDETLDTKRRAATPPAEAGP